MACCELVLPNGKICGEFISTKGGPTGMKNHVMYVHPDEYIKLAPATEPIDMKFNPSRPPVAIPANQRDNLHTMHARWLVKKKRPLSLAEDKEYRELWTMVMKGSYTPPCHKLVMSNVLQLSGEGQKNVFKVVMSLRAVGIKPALAGDIWSDRGVSILGMTLYYMKNDWTIAQTDGAGSHALLGAAHRCGYRCVRHLPPVRSQHGLMRFTCYWMLCIWRCRALAGRLSAIHKADPPAPPPDRRKDS